MQCTIARLTAFAGLLGMLGCVEASPPAANDPTPVLHGFKDPFGRVPVAFDLHVGERVDIAYVDSLLLSRSQADQQRQAQVIARHLWRLLAQQVDTVAVAFTDRRSPGTAGAQKTTHTFLFYSEQLREDISPRRAWGP